AARGGVRHGSVHARAPRGGRAGRLSRRGLLPVQRGDRLVLPFPGGGLARVPGPGRRLRARRGRVSRRPALPREPAPPPALLLEAQGSGASGAGEEAPPARDATAGRSLPRGARPLVPRRRALARLRGRRVAPRAMNSIELYFRLGFAVAVLLAPGFFLAWAL